MINTFISPKLGAFQSKAEIAVTLLKAKHTVVLAITLTKIWTDIIFLNHHCKSASFALANLGLFSE